MSRTAAITLSDAHLERLTEEKPITVNLPPDCSRLEIRVGSALVLRYKLAELAKKARRLMPRAPFDF